MNNYSFIILAIVSMGLGACTSSRPLFGNHRPTADEDLLIQQYFQAPAPVLGVGDKLTLSVWGHEELSVGSLNSTFSANASSGRWLTIDQDGEVNLPRLGRYHLAGHNEKEASYLLEQAYGQILQNPIVNVRVISHQVTILGEVRSPGQYQLNSELVNLVQLLGRAGGLDTYADARAVRIIRETTKGTVTLAADLSEMQHFSRYNVVLQPNDIVYIDANKLKATDESLRRAGPFVSILTGIGVLASLIAR